MKTRIFAYILTLALCFSLMPNTVWAADRDFVIDDNGILTAYNGPGGNVVIPDGVRYVGFLGTFNGVEIDSGYVFAGRKDITSISIPNSVIYIGKGAFSGCTGLTSVTIPSSVTRTGTEIFSGCTGLTYVTIPGSVEKVETAAFMGCTNLRNVTLGDGIKAIGGESFRACTSLTNIFIPDSVSKIEGISFLDCISLADVRIPKNATIEGNAFGGTPWLEKQGDWVVINGSLIAYKGTEIDITIPNGVTSLGDGWCQYGGGDVRSVTLPNSVTKIGAGAFWYFSGISSIDIPNSVTYIGSRAFACTGLTKVVIPDSVTTIGNAAFEECQDLTDIVIPNSVTVIDPSKGGIPAFNKSPNVTIHGSAGSYAESYAKEHGIPFIADLIPVVTVGGFHDVREKDYFAQPVLWAVEKGITSGTSANTFSPNRVCSKAEILTFLWRSQGKPEPTISAPYSNLSPSDYYYKAALWACEAGVVSSGDFGRECTRSSAVTYLWILAGRPSAPVANFDDVPKNADYAQAVAWAVQQGITSGTSKTTFSPEATCARGQIVTFLYRAYGK